MDQVSAEKTALPLPKILLVDDDSGVLCALKMLMQALGYSVVDFARPLEALEYLRANPHRCELVICDLRMPQINGLRVLEEAKKISPSLPFVLMSAHASNEDQARARELGCFGFLAKPFTPDDLAKVVAQIQMQVAV